LRVLQEREFEPVGSQVSQKTNARIITATNKDLLSLVSEGKFREDLYYRLNVIKINLPSLAERIEDIPFLVDLFILRFNQLHKKSIKGASPEALKQLQSYSWPGNIRELENSIERACILCPGSYIQLGCFPFITSENSQAEKIAVEAHDSLGASREESEKQMIINALNNNHSKIATAKALGIHKTTLFRKMKKYQIAF